MYSIGNEPSIGAGIAAILLIAFLIWVGRVWLRGMKISESVFDEVIRFEKNKIAKKKHTWEESK